jgi:Txe/YoeB family toxin of Txe-Axe toxin-antitoxin module
MKKIFILWIILSLLLSSCSIDWNDEKDKKISELEKQIQNDTFKKKQECEKYKDKFEDKLEKKSKERDLIYDLYYENLNEIFYSNSKSSCFAVSSFSQVKFDKESLNEEWFIITDLLTWDVTRYTKDDLFKYYYPKLKELKWK